MNAAQQAAERAARESFGRLVSWLAWQWHDIAAAEDALSDALLKALEVWPVQGVPEVPDAWLLAVAKRQLLQMARHDRVRFDPALAILFEPEQGIVAAPAIPDARLKLMFVCAHPAIDEKIRMPLMLQTVMGLQVSEIAPAMLMSPTALAQRLVRAKQKIRDAALRFEEPEAADLPQRLHYVLESIYGVFGLSTDVVDVTEARSGDLQQEAIFLGALVAALLPDAAEAQGLHALMRFCLARRAAQTAPDGSFIALRDQDVGLWDRESIVAADQCLWIAAQRRTPGPFQLEAAVQSAHCQRLFTGTTPWRAIASLYAEINRYFPTEGSRVAGAVATAEAGDADAGLRQLLSMDTELLQQFQPWWAARAHLLCMLGREREADLAFQTAIGLSTQQRIKDHLERRRHVLGEAHRLYAMRDNR